VVLLGRLRARLTGSPKSGLSAELSTLIGPCALSDGSLPLLGMGRDVPDGVMRLRRGNLDVDWTTVTSAHFFGRMRDDMRRVADDLGARFEDNPLWGDRRVVTVHPLGGAPMGRHPGEAVCNAHGEVFGFPGLFVLDGSAMPGPVGANPSLTIAALADRACDHLLSALTAPSRPAAPPARVPAPVVPAPEPGPPAGATGLSFVEEMKGFVALDVTDPREGAALGRQLGQRLMFHLTIATDDVDRFVVDPDHQARATGWVECDVLGGRLPVAQGWFNLFVAADDGSEEAPTRRMLYRLHLGDPGDTPLTLIGHKQVHDDPGLDLWPDTSTLYVRILSGHVPAGEDEDAPVLAAGMITIHVGDFGRQMTTFRTDGPRPVHALEAFGRLFLGRLWEVYGPRAEAASR
jgi:cholesterol oxidase